MTDYTPFKYACKRLSKNNQVFKSLTETVKPKPYTLKMEGTREFANIKTERLTSEQHKLANELYWQKFRSQFPRGGDSNKAIVRTYDAVPHRDEAWDSNLFLSIVLQAAPKGHLLAAGNWQVQEDEPFKLKSIYLRQGDVFLLDPYSIHMVISTSRIRQELILLQYELEFGTRDKALMEMRRSTMSSVYMESK